MKQGYKTFEEILFLIWGFKKYYKLF